MAALKFSIRNLCLLTLIATVWSENDFGAFVREFQKLKEKVNIMENSLQECTENVSNLTKIVKHESSMYIYLLINENRKKSSFVMEFTIAFKSIKPASSSRDNLKCIGNSYMNQNFQWFIARKCIHVPEFSNALLQENSYIYQLFQCFIAGKFIHVWQITPSLGS